jgi:hypothetical protein
MQESQGHFRPNRRLNPKPKFGGNTSTPHLRGCRTVLTSRRASRSALNGATTSTRKNEASSLAMHSENSRGWLTPMLTERKRHRHPHDECIVSLLTLENGNGIEAPTTDVAG